MIAMIIKKRLYFYDLKKDHIDVVASSLPIAEEESYILIHPSITSS
jgi:hypothetical protein